MNSEREVNTGARAASKGATEGPWQSQHEWDIDGICTIIGAIDGPDDGRMHYTRIADVVTDDPAEARANAALIAAAPELKEALKDLLAIIDAAGLLNLSNGVQLGPTVWYVKATERVDYAREVLAKVRA